MGIYTIDKTGVKVYIKKMAGKEKHIEDFLEKHVTVLDPNIFVIGRQVRTDNNNVIDLMGMDWKGNTIIIEVKRGMTPREVISQALDYAVWAENVDYDRLNSIAKGKYKNLHELFKSKSKPIPEPWNENQKIYIVAERVDEKTKDMASYLSRRRVDVKCVELNFYENAEQKIVNVDFVGEQIDMVDEVGKKVAQTWDNILENATENNRAMVNGLIKKVKAEIKQLAVSKGKYYYMRVKDQPKKNQFGAIVCQKKSAYVHFRVDPDTFGYDDNSEIRSVRWFFTKETERKVILTESNFDLILKCLKHAHGTTSKLK